MRVMVLGANGYLGWPTSMRLALHGHEVIAVDNYYKKTMMANESLKPLYDFPKLHSRISEFKKQTGRQIELGIINVCSCTVIGYIKEVKPDVIIHYAEQPSAPYSMIDRNTCIESFHNNLVGTLNIMWAIKNTDTHLIKLGTMGEYGTPNVHIPEGWIDFPDVEGSLWPHFNPAQDDTKIVKLPFPKLPGSFYHASKVADSVNLEFGCRAWNLRVTDLNQGIVYGYHTTETRLSDGLHTTFYYDSVFGTALNRFIAQAVCGKPITVYGKGGQTRGWLNIEDTLQCVELAMLNPPDPGEFKVRNQFTEIFSVLDLAELVKDTLGGQIQTVMNPRIELEQHYYSASNQSFLDLGLKPIKLDLKIIEEIACEVRKRASSIKEQDLYIRVDW